MNLVDIQKESDKIVLTFCDSETIEDCLIIKVSKEDIVSIAEFFRRELSYRATKKLTE